MSNVLSNNAHPPGLLYNIASHSKSGHCIIIFYLEILGKLLKNGLRVFFSTEITNEGVSISYFSVT